MSFLLGDVMLKIIPSRRLLLRLLVVDLILLNIKMQNVSEQKGIPLSLSLSTMNA